MRLVDPIRTFLVASLTLLPPAVFASPVGEAVAVDQAAVLERSGQRIELVAGAEVAMGDIITTGAAGQAQLLFKDETRIVVGSNSRLVIESILFDTPTTASSFTVSAVEGAFRFLSGNSEKSAYSIRTPNGTMGIRGTEFDFTVTPVE